MRLPTTLQDPFGKSAARQEDRDVAALFTVRYGEALLKLRQREYTESDKGVPIEWFTFERLIIDVSSARQHWHLPSHPHSPRGRSLPLSLSLHALLVTLSHRPSNTISPPS